MDDHRKGVRGRDSALYWKVLTWVVLWGIGRGKRDRGEGNSKKQMGRKRGRVIGALEEVPKD